LVTLILEIVYGRPSDLDYRLTRSWKNNPC
jgi:hypothetical protein